MNDDYDHVDISIFYIEENIPGPNENSAEFTNLINNYNSQLENQCTCVDNCTYPKCECLQQSGGNNYIFDHGNLPKLRFSDEKQNPILECNKLCSCVSQCGNRLVQLGPLKSLVIKKCETAHKGFGLFTDAFINSGSFICQYAGELLTRNQATEGYRQNLAKGEMNYIFCLNEHCDEGVIETFVDPSKFGNIGRYINHSCEPNALIVPVRYDIPTPKLAIFASMDIQSGSEITYNYSSNSNICVNDLVRRKKCFCKSSSCKGYMPYDEV